VLPTFVIGLREGLEASLIVGIVAAFMVRNGRRNEMWALWTGVGFAVTLCLAGGIALRMAERNLPQRQQEGLETVIGLVAVVFVSWMILWMRGHARELKGDLEASAAAALATGSAWALVLMAFLAVLREGFETAVFLLAILQSSTNSTSSLIGAVLGIVVAVVIGYAVYRGGVNLNMGRFFKLTGIVLVLVAAGLLAMAAHTAHEAAWLNSMQGHAIDLRWLVDPGSVRAALLTGMFGLQPRPTWAEVIVWVAYAVPFLVIVIVPPRQAAKHKSVSTTPVTVGS
jgi:high-affinity iron transporter